MNAESPRVVSITADQAAITIHIRDAAPPLSASQIQVYEMGLWQTHDAEGIVCPGEAVPLAAAVEITIPRYDGTRDRLFARFRVTDANGLPIAGICYVDRLENSAQRDYPYPTAPTIKGLQVNMVDDAIRLGVGHAALNLNLPSILRPAGTPGTIPFTVDGRTFCFDSAYMADFDARVKELSDHGIVVNLILLASRKWGGSEIHPDLAEALLHPDYDPEGFISAFNVVTEEGVACYRAFVEFVADRYTRPDQQFGRACGLIIGNEVDSQWIWCNAGEKPIEEYVRQHGLAMRIAHYAARRHYAHARVYLSLDHMWGIPYQDVPGRYYRGRDVVETLAALGRAEGDFDWAMAYHPYPENLAHPDFWNDKTALDALDTPRITFKNIEVLSRYLNQPHLLYQGRQRNIILSEQGFHSDENEESERTAAAAYAYAYWKISRTPGIEAFILHAHVDNRDEFDLNLGIWRRDKESPSGNAPGTPKPIYEVFRDIDGPNRLEVLRRARAEIDTEHWPEEPT